MVYKLDLDFQRYGTNNWHHKFIKMCKDDLFAVSVDDNNCHIFLSCLNFVRFPGT